MKFLIYPLFSTITFSLVGMHIVPRKLCVKKNILFNGRSAINKSDELDIIRQKFDINNSPQEVRDISQGKVIIKEDIPLGKRYGTCHNYAFTKLMGIVGKAPALLNISGQRDYYSYAEIKCDGKEELCGLDIVEFFDVVDGTSIQPGDIAVYMSDDTEKNLINRIMHTGIVVGDDCIESKWGPNRAVFEHPIWYVPAHFGIHIVYCRLNIEKSRLLGAVQEKLNQEPIKKKYAELAHKNQQELFDHIKQYGQEKSISHLSKIYGSLEYDMNTHLTIPDENGVTPLMHADNIGCETLKELFEMYQAHRE